MNPKCAKCNKTVYPVEKLTCLDKAWHKGCFRCMECNLLLTMKSYKGYNKMPYCNTHYPTTSFTAVADTPENRRLAQQTKNQSELVYRKDKEEALREFTQVADSVSNRQASQQQRLASNIGYQTAPHEQERAGGGYQPPSYGGGHQPPPPTSYNQPPPPTSYNQPPPQIPPPVAAPSPSRTPKGPRYIAMYDYTAADDDEVSFVEGDEIIEATIIDEGWMEGRVVRTNQYGMLPSNYVEKQ